MPCDYSLYPANWFTEIRPSILSRAGEQHGPDGELIEEATCEEKGCNARNHARGMRDIDGVFHELGEPLFDTYEYPEKARPFQIIITVAHVDHDKANNDLDNLRAWCQLHHLRHDAKQHARNARATREIRSGQGTLAIEGGIL